MRVCHLLETAGGGSGQVVLDLIEAGLALGDDLTLLYSPLRAEPRFIEKAKAFTGSLRLRPLPMRRSVGLHDFFSYLSVLRALREEGPFDVIHSHSSKAGGLARLARFAAPGAVQVYSPHAFVTMKPGALCMYRLMEKILAPLADGIVCVSEAEKRHAEQELHLPPERLFLVPNGTRPCPPEARDAARERIGFPESACIAGFVGRCVPQKNLRRVVEAFKVQAKKHPALCLVVIGDGPLRSEAEERIAAAGLGPRTRFLGEQLSSCFVPGFDLLLCGSDYEALSLVFLEALAAGVPIVSTPVGGTEECVFEGKTGFVAKDFSEAALAEALGAYLSLSAEERTERASNARLQSERFTIAAQAAAMREVYVVCQKRRAKASKQELVA